MKLRYLLYVSVLLFNSVAYSQNVVEQFKDFYTKSDFDCYIDSYQKECAIRYGENTEQFKERCWFSKFNKENMVFILNVQFANTELYNFEDDIYNYLVVDSTMPFSIAFVDKKMNVSGIWTLSRYPYLSTVKKRDKIHRDQLKEINKEDPELILFFPNIGVRGSSYLHYIKDGKIYVFNLQSHISYELNKFTRSDFSSFTLSTVRQQSRIIDMQTNTVRYGGHTPSELVRVCPPLH